MHTCVHIYVYMVDKYMYTFICVTWLIHMCDVTHSYVWRDWFICLTWLIHMCDMTDSYVWHDSFICVTWLIHMCDVTHSYVRHDSFICVTWLLQRCDVTHSYGDMTDSYVRRDSFICVTWLIHIRDMTHPYTTWLMHMRHHSHKWISHICDRLIHMCDMTESYVWHEWFMCVTWMNHKRCIMHTYEWVISARVAHSFTHTNESCVWQSHIQLIHMCGMTHL